MQRTNCQEWDHGERNCYSLAKCCRCAEEHKSSECPHLKEDEKRIPANLVKCANCGGNHTAGYSGCKAKYNYEVIQQRMRDNARINAKTQQNEIPRNNDINFPPLKHITRYVEAPKPKQNFWDNRLSLSTNQQQNDLLSADECLQVMNELLQKLAECRTRTQQIRTIGAIAIKYVFGGRP